MTSESLPELDYIVHEFEPELLPDERLSSSERGAKQAAGDYTVEQVSPLNEQGMRSRFARLMQGSVILHFRVRKEVRCRPWLPTLCSTTGGSRRLPPAEDKP